MITQDQLKQHLNYDPETGIFTRIAASSHNVKIGDIAGQTIEGGYIRIQVLRCRRLAHCLAWLYMTGRWPSGEVDHRNGVTNDNRWGNLRDATKSINQQNVRRARKTSTTGLLGVSRMNKKYFQATIRVNGKKMHLGTFPTPQLAHDAYVKAKRQYHEGCTI